MGSLPTQALFDELKSVQTGLGFAESTTLEHVVARYGDEDLILGVHNAMTSRQLFTLLKLCTNNGSTPFHLAATDKSKNLLETLPALKPDSINELLQIRDENGSTPLHSASASGHLNMMTSMQQKIKYEDWNQLLFIEDNAGRTPLHVSMTPGFSCSVEVVAFIWKSCSLNTQIRLLRSQNKRGQTPLHVAATNKSEAFLEILSAIESEVLIGLLRISDGKEHDVPSVALHFCHFNWLLVCLPRKITWKALLAIKIYLCRIILHFDSDCHIYDEFLVRIWQRWKEDRIDLLMIHKDKNSRTLLHLAARKGCTILFKQMNELCNEKKTMLLKMRECNLHTPLHLAIVSYQPEVVRIISSLVKESEWCDMLQFPAGSPQKTPILDAMTSQKHVELCQVIQSTMSREAWLNLVHSQPPQQSFERAKLVEAYRKQAQEYVVSSQGLTGRFMYDYQPTNLIHPIRIAFGYHT